jgi:hypothetical protein
MASDSAHSGAQESVLKVVELVLQKSDLQPGDDFFDVGGTSLAAMQIILKFFDAPDLRAVAELIEQRLPGATR